MDTIRKYLVEKRLKNTVNVLKELIQKPKTAKYTIDGVDVEVTHSGKVLIFEYPSKEASITYNLIQASDALNKKYNQIGLTSGKEMEFIIKL